MHHARKHAETRIRERRQRLAAEAARIMSSDGIRDFRQAKMKAAARLGIHDDASLPRNVEIEEALRTHQRLFRGHEQPELLRTRREAAARAMHFFARFDPRLVGAVLEGTADAYSPVCLHLFADEPEAVARYLLEQGVPAEEGARRIRLDRKREADAPVWTFTAEDLPFDLTVLPRAVLRQAPLDPVAGRPMRRASLAALETLLAEEEIAQYASANDED
ncbi:hypothetical protein [Coralloluteibacterium thermophilus]|uniref:Uncharacterized protein n=1 Tax=Coralloluteibacterium thermophilum TaxID=2707049 RepID=A0ABV9NM11_9GAMM